MKLLALDLALKTGWALGGEAPFSGIWDLRGAGRPDHGRYLSSLAGSLERCLQSHMPDCVVFEAPLPPRARAKISNE
ncbi:MAG TPA: hypothetical protein VHQ92_07215, partial [Pseudolabrys sp.]|nr:hypothetical protein [Pseudolabrys sp.]